MAKTPKSNLLDDIDPDKIIPIEDSQKNTDEGVNAAQNAKEKAEKLVDKAIDKIQNLTKQRTNATLLERAGRKLGKTMIKGTLFVTNLPLIGARFISKGFYKTWKFGGSMFLGALQGIGEVVRSTYDSNIKAGSELQIPKRNPSSTTNDTPDNIISLNERKAQKNTDTNSSNYRNAA